MTQSSFPKILHTFTTSIVPLLSSNNAEEQAMLLRALEKFLGNPSFNACLKKSTDCTEKWIATLVDAQKKCPHAPLVSYVRVFQGKALPEALARHIRHSVRDAVAKKKMNHFVRRNGALTLRQKAKFLPLLPAKNPMSYANDEAFRSPYVLLGFYHSGTRLLSQYLHQMGVFQAATSDTYEWRYIQLLNGAMAPEWNVPGKVSPKGAGKFIDKEDLLNRLVSYGYRGGQWGIKDPRLDVTLGAWLEAFPDAVCIHIVRDPVDVLGTLPSYYKQFAGGEKLPQQDPAHWCNWWKENYNNVVTLTKNHKAYIRIRFEDLCNDPMQVLSAISTACDLKKPIERKTKLITTDKIGAHIEWIKNGKLTIETVNVIERELKEEREELGY